LHHNPQPKKQETETMQSHKLNYKIQFKNGTDYSDFEIVDGDICEFAKLLRSGDTGIDIDNIDYISLWDDNGREF